MDGNLLEKSIEQAKRWAQNPYFDQEDRETLQQMIEKRSEELVESFYKDLEFGTGGLRSVIGLGTNRINKYNVRKATQAMCNIVHEEGHQEPSACISFDCRDFSIVFAQEVASVFAANGIKAYLFRELTPTPLLSYAVREHKSVCGVMITASHNPKQYNGFKAYWSDGGQVTPPQDSKVIAAYNKISDWNQVKSISFEQGLDDSSIEYISGELTEKYYKIVESKLVNPQLCKEKGSELKVVYTSLHGTGLIPCCEISQRLGFSEFKALEEQMPFDGSFSTVRSTPNPEDPIALENAVDKMLSSQADLVYGTDPDCDRLGVVVNHQGKAQYLNGNQIAFLMIDYILSQRQKNSTLPSNPLIIKSIVTSELQKSIAAHYGATVMDTLTGFKWMAMLWKELQEQGTDFNYLFASEESFGYMPHDEVRDKDAIAAIALMNEVALFHKLNGKNLIEALDDIYEKFGFAQESLIAKTYEGIEGAKKITRIMDYFRANQTNDIASEKVAKVSDYLSLETRDYLTDKKKPISAHASNLLGFEFQSGHKLFLRPSGTEPKIKFYTMVQINEGELESKKKAAKEKIEEIEDFINMKIEKI